jgi:CBS domain-containing protein
MAQKKLVRDAMTANPTTVTPNTSLVEAARMMRDQDIGPLPIVDGETLVGMLTDRDIVVRAVAEGKDLQTSTVGEIASRDVVTVDPDQSLDEAMQLMEQHQIRRLPVAEEDGRLVGILAQADVAQHADEAKAGEMVEQISR